MKNANRKYAIIAGISLIVMALAAGYSYGYVFGSLVETDNPSSTLMSLNHSKGIFGSGVIGWLVILITDLLLAWSLYRYFLQVNAKVSLATGLIRAVYSAVLALAIYQLIIVWSMLPATKQDTSVLMQQFADFEKYWSMGLILFGVHLIGLGFLSIKSKTVPNWMGWLLYIAGLSYIAIHGAKAMALEATGAIAMAEMLLAAPMALAELGLAVWLLWRGGKEIN
jgi:hypothetical protein